MQDWIIRRSTCTLLPHVLYPTLFTSTPSLSFIWYVATCIGAGVQTDQIHRRRLDLNSSFESNFSEDTHTIFNADHWMTALTAYSTSLRTSLVIFHHLLSSAFCVVACFIVIMDLFCSLSFCFRHFSCFFVFLSLFPFLSTFASSLAHWLSHVS